MSSDACSRSIEGNGGLALWIALVIIVVVSASSFAFCYQRRQKDDEDKLVRYYLAMIHAGKIPNPLLDGNFEVDERRRRRSLEDQQQQVDESSPHVGGSREQDPDIEAAAGVEMRSRDSNNRRSPSNNPARTSARPPGPPPSQITNDDIAVDLVTEMSALEAAIAESKQHYQHHASHKRELEESDQVLHDHDTGTGAGEEADEDDEDLRRAIQESKQAYAAQQSKQAQA